MADRDSDIMVDVLMSWVALDVVGRWLSFRCWASSLFIPSLTQVLTMWVMLASPAPLEVVLRVVDVGKNVPVPSVL